MPFFQLVMIGRCDYDQAYKMIILAEQEEDAREIAQTAGKDECWDYSKGYSLRKPIPFWTDPTKTLCEVIPIDGPSRVILVQTLDG